MNWDGLVALVTGASSGFGLETAHELARRGATVIAVARREEKLAALVKALSGEGHSYVTCDVSDLGRIREMALEVGKRTSRLDILVNNAGIGTSGSIIEATSEEMERVVRTNLMGTIWCTKELLPLLQAAPTGSRTPVVVNVSSMGGRIPLPGYGDYIASKFGMVGFTESAASELDQLGVRSMMVLPGIADTEGFPVGGIRKSPLTRWTVMGPERVATALAAGIEKGSFEVRVQWWLTPLYYASVALGPLRRPVSTFLRQRFDTDSKD